MKTQIIKSRCGSEFALNERLMIHINPLSGSFYFTERRYIHNALKHGYRVEHALAIKNSDDDFRVRSCSPAYITLPKLHFQNLQIGCMQFTGASMKALLKWAKSYRPGKNGL